MTSNQKKTPPTTQPAQQPASKQVNAEPTPTTQTEQKPTNTDQKAETSPSAVNTNKSQTQLNSAELVNKQTSKLLKITSITLIILLAITTAISIYIKQQYLLLSQTKAQIISTRKGNNNLRIAMDYIEASDVQIDLLLNSLPGDETELVEFVQAVEAIAANHTTNLSLKFNASAPTGFETEKFIPFRITFSSDQPNLLEFLAKFEKLPYIIDIATIESEKSFDSDTLWNYNILANIYVRDPFKL